MAGMSYAQPPEGGNADPAHGAGLHVLQHRGAPGHGELHLAGQKGRLNHRDAVIVLLLGVKPQHEVGHLVSRLVEQRGHVPRGGQALTRDRLLRGPQE